MVDPLQEGGEPEAEAGRQEDTAHVEAFLPGGQSVHRKFVKS